MTMLPPPNPNDPSAAGLGVIGTTNLNLLYGSVEAVVQQATVGGAVTYLTLINQVTKDEIDFEWIGNERNTVWTNFFYRGLREREPVTMNEVWSEQVSSGSGDNAVNAHTYRIDWTPDAITWYVDGSVVRTQQIRDTYEAANQGDGLPYDHYHYPNTPLSVNVGLWNYQGPIWANGPINWNDASVKNGVSASILSLKVSCYQGAIPQFTDPTVVPGQPDIFHNGKQTIAPPSQNGPVVTTTSAVIAPTSPIIPTTTAPSSVGTSDATSTTTTNSNATSALTNTASQSTDATTTMTASASVTSLATSTNTASTVTATGGSGAKSSTTPASSAYKAVLGLVIGVAALIAL
ncbi:concanavalin A-like lectin/glucanase [Rhizoclosmatium globosum]|uniref:Concanavalin A-like lectin/glucanase n=1 Tax=Rhizoclosmatium globosum TaxID=329046 RepID=A0A1Y2CLA3_9FUNG|nr:concanavalin A-like lectin/glucanase [Rhizoclosmatium globosum]|eukprot:ORY47790.1 concanavalin A-like lectin/glucanase [Rhizoclosmatium globosum]